jgi:sugar phosphate isomerase/epimerase
MNRLSLPPLTIGNAGPLAVIAAAAAAGFDAVGLRLLAAPGTAAAEPLIGNPRRIAETGARLADSGLVMLSATGIWLESGTDVASLRPALETAATLGSRYFLTVGNDPEPGRLRDNFARLAEAAGGYGLTLALEFMPAARVNSLAMANGLVAGTAHAGILVDALHLARSGGTPAEVAALPPGRIAYFQLCDAAAKAPPPAELRREALMGRLHPGEGGLSLLALMDALPADIDIDLETPVAADADLPPLARAARAAEAARRFLNHDRRRRGSWTHDERGL